MSGKMPESLLDLLQERRKLQQEREELEDSIPAIRVVPKLHIGTPDQYSRAKQRITQIDDEIGLLNERIAQLRLATKTVEKSRSSIKAKGHEAEAIVWLGNNREFGEMILDLYEKGLIRAKSKTDALTQATKHFVGKNGRRFGPRSTLQNFKNKRDFTT